MPLYPYGFAAMQSVSSTVQVYISGDAPLYTGQTLADAPHLVGFPYGAGKVVYTSFHQEPGVHPQMEQVLHLLMFEL